MARKLRVYVWEGVRGECPTHSPMTREIVAATSQVEAARIAGVRSPRQLFNLCETGNADELATARAEPATVFWRPLDAYGDVWRRATPPAGRDAER